MFKKFLMLFIMVLFALINGICTDETVTVSDVVSIVELELMKGWVHHVFKRIGQYIQRKRTARDI